MPDDDLPSSMPPSGAPPQRTTGGGMKWTPPSPEHLQRMLSQYEILSMLGHGGMGAVYKARQKSLDRLVAIKILPPEAASDEEQFIARFQNEARTMAKMNHPAIVGVYDFGETAEGQLYFVMEFVDGTDVAQMIKGAGHLPPDHALAITAHVCDALFYAHNHGVIHRDIKPANILINRDGQVKVADFGLAKLDDPSMTTGLTKSNMAMGTPDFVAPEVLTIGTVVDHRADLYAIGVMLYQMLTGEIPRGMFKMPSQKVGSDPRFDAIVTKAMESDREARFQTAAEIRQDLDRILTTPLVKAGDQQAQPAVPKQQRGPRVPSRPPAQPVALSPAPPPPKSKIPLLIGLIAAVVVVIGAVFLFSGKDNPAPKTETSVASAPSPPSASPPKPKPSPAPVPVSTPPQPGPFTAPVPVLSARAADILPVVDVTQDAVSGAWIKDGDGVRLEKRKGPRDSHIEMPVVCTGSYLIEVEFTPGPQDGTMGIHLPYAPPNAAGLNALTFTFNFGTQGTKSAGFSVFPKLNRTGVASAKLEASPPQRTRLTLRVEIKPSNQLALGAWHSGKPLIGWEGDRSVPQGPDDNWLPKHPPRFTLGTFVDGTVFHRVRVEALDGEVQWLRDPASIAKAAPIAPSPPTSSPPATAASPVPMPVAPAPALPDPVSAKLAGLEKTFLDVYEKQVGAAHKAAVTDLNTKFTAALDRSIATVSQAGKLEEGLALQNEKKYLLSSGTVPVQDEAEVPETLKALRKAYRGQMATLIANREKLAAPVHTGYDRLLAAYQDELTRASKLDEAARVKAVREHITAQRESASAAQASAPVASTGNPAPAVGAASSGKTPIPVAPIAPPLSADKILPPPPKATQEEVHALVEWCIGQRKGSVRLLVDGEQRTFESLDTLPKGKFTLVHFYIYELAMDDEGKKWLSILGRVPDLESMFFHKNPGTFPMETLRGLTKLKSLHLTPTAVEDAAFAHLTGLKSLEELKLTYYLKQFNGTGLGHITENLRVLELNAATLKAEGLAYLPRFKKLKRLAIYGDGVGTDRSANLTDEMFRGLAALSDLEELELRDIPLDGSFLAFLPQNSRLKRLNLEKMTSFKPEHLVQLARLRNLEMLSLPPVDPGAAGMAAIASLDMLNELAAIENHAFTGESFKGLKGFKNLRRLNLHISPVSDAALDAFSTAIPGLKSFEMTNAAGFKTTITVEGFTRACARLRSLTSLQFHGERTTDEWMPAIAQLKALDYLMLTGASITDQGLTHLSKLPLGYLRLDGTGITDAALPILKTIPTLGNVPVGGTKMTDPGKKELQKMIEGNKGK